MRFTLGRFYARLPKLARWCCTKLLMALGLVLVLFVVFASGLDQKDLPDWLKDKTLGIAAIGLLSFTVGVFGNVVADRYLKWESLRLPSVKEFFGNNHLTQLVGQSLGMVLRQVAGDLKDSADGRLAYGLARHIEKHWIDLSKSEQGQRWLFAIQDRQLVQFVRDPRQPALNYQQAEALLALANPDGSGVLPSFVSTTNLATVRTQLITRFGEALRESLKRDFAQRGEGAMGMLLDIAGEMLKSGSTRVVNNDENHTALLEIRQTLKTLSTGQIATDPAFQKRLEALTQELQDTRAAVLAEGQASAERDSITHNMLAELERKVNAFISPKLADEDPTKLVLSPELIEQVKLLQERGNREQQALAQIALKQHAEADRIIQELKKDPVAEAFRLLTLEGDNWYNAGQYDRAIEPYEQALALRPNDILARNHAAIAHCKTQLGDTGKHLQRAVDLFSGILQLAEQKSEDPSEEESTLGWTMLVATKINLGSVLLTQGERTEGDAGASLRERAVAVTRCAQEDWTREVPLLWAAIQTSLGNALSVQGQRTKGEAGVQLLEQAVAAYRAALDVSTGQEVPPNWLMIQTNLGNTLAIQGERTEGEGGEKLLEQAVAAHRAALEACTPEAPATQTSLGSALGMQGHRTEGKAGAMLLEHAVAMKNLRMAEAALAGRKQRIG